MVGEEETEEEEVVVVVAAERTTAYQLGCRDLDGPREVDDLVSCSLDGGICRVRKCHAFTIRTSCA